MKFNKILRHKDSQEKRQHYVSGLKNRFKKFKKLIRITTDIRSLYYLVTIKRLLKNIKITFNGKKILLITRTGSSDTRIREEIFTKDCQYAIPIKIDPKIIFDIGACTRMVSIYYSVIYPNAKIYAFEPFPENYDLLKKNIDLNSDNIVPINKGLGAEEGCFTYNFSDDPFNYGGGTFKNIWCDKNKKFELPITTFYNIIEEKKIHGIDILKIDTEGMEYDIITNIPNHVLKNIKVIVGELHGIKDLDVLNYLSDFFKIGFNKKYDQRCFNFIAVNKEV